MSPHLEQLELVVEMEDSQGHQLLGKYGQFAMSWKCGRGGVFCQILCIRMKEHSIDCLGVELLMWKLDLP